MPSSSTITSWNVFSPDTLIESAKVNSNFDVFRGHIIPVNPNTSAASDNTYDLGSADYRWRNIYAQNIIFASATSNQPTWFKYTVDFSDFDAATIATDIELFSNPAKGVIHGVLLANATAFSGGSLSGYQLSVGISGSLDKFASLVSVNTSTVNESFLLLEMPNVSTSTSIRIQAVASGSNLDSATAGQIDVYVLRSLLP